MKKIVTGILGLALVASLNLPAKADPVPDHIRRLWDGIRELRGAHMILDSEAGTDFGGQREAAEQQIDAALNELSQSVEFFRTQVAHQANPWPAPNLEPGPEPGGGHEDHIHRLDRGLRHLERAHHILDGMAGEEYGGHRANAERDIDQAVQDLHAAQQFFRSHR